MTPTLYIFSGLPAAGKSTLAKYLTERTKSTYIRIDTIEQGLRDICKMDNLEGEGYRLSYLIAKDNLKSGNNVIADSVNPWELTRMEWNEVANSVGAKYVNIEVVCSNEVEHRLRVKKRKVDLENLKLPSWKKVKNRDYHRWNMPRIKIDTYGKTIEESINELLEYLSIK